MLLETLVAFLTAASPAKPPAVVVAPASVVWRTPAPAYAPDKRAVDNWRIESASWLEMSPVSALRRALAAEENDPARCVKLNNYWCVKRAGWNGEIASDADGHVAFASAEEGAAVAALLLRRYYVDYKRRSARAIVERWAPAQCSPMIARATPGPAASREGMARMLPQRVVPMGLAPQGIQNTLRARWLAAHGRGGVASPSPTQVATRAEHAKKIAELRLRAEAYRQAALRRFRHRPPHPPGLMPTPSIMDGVEEAHTRPKRAPAAKPATDDEATIDTASALADIPAPSPPPPFVGVVNCSGELARIANYAAHVAEGVAASPNDDLLLFTDAGQPTGNLEKVLANMAAVEIGPARPRMGLVTAAVAQLRRLLAAPVAAAEPAPTPGNQQETLPARHQPQ
ncbi:hypothetical protein ACNHKD_15355 [Methylocystis sp. JAN1]|uniref:hypothetical protein n=1 Tax=Methylocystis sp. JAN1 TaxID=3397211 RepID=UPI003FA2DD9A